MKIYDRYRQALADLTRNDARLSKAWYTSFNLDIGFIEAVLLPPLVGTDDRPRNEREYELIQQSIDELDISLHFFCDHRVLDLGSGKKTAVPVHPLVMSAFVKQFQNGFFHPKVIYLENDRGEAQLLCGSANLTYSGWAQNRESVQCVPVAGAQNRDELAHFFKQIFNAAHLEMPGLQKLSGSAAGAKDDYTFISSFSGEKKRLPALLQQQASDYMHVWSPYFGSDIEGLFEEQFSECTEVGLVPDRDEQGWFRVSRSRQKAVLNAGNSKQRINFYSMKYPDDSDEYRMTHAKLWLTENSLAVGSWNLSRAALGLNSNSLNNVEAGIIVQINKLQRKALLGKLCAANEKENFPDAVEDELPDAWKHEKGKAVFVTADWNTFRYKIDFVTEEDWNGAVLILPGDQHWSAWDAGSPSEIRIDNTQALLGEHFFTVRTENDSFTGIIHELNCRERPVWRFPNLAELLHSLAQGRSLEAISNEQTVLAYSRGSDLAEENAGRLSAVTDEKRITLSYYQMFEAFTAFREQLERLSGMEDQQHLVRHIFSAPGNIEEICKNIVDLFQESQGKTDAEVKKESEVKTEEVKTEEVNTEEVNTSNGEHTDVYLWFLVQEARLLGQSALAKLEREEHKEHLVEELEKLRVPVLPVHHSAWLDYIMKESGYEQKT